MSYSPQLRGKAERLNWSLLEKTKAMISDSGIRKVMWGEAARCAAYLLNRSSTSNLDTMVYDKWNLKKPDL